MERLLLAKILNASNSLCYWQRSATGLYSARHNPPLLTARRTHHEPHSYPWLPVLPQRTSYGISRSPNGSREDLSRWRVLHLRRSCGLYLATKSSGSERDYYPAVGLLCPYPTRLPDTHEEWMHRKFLEAGVAVAGIDMGEAYGNPESRKIFDKFYDELTERRQMSKKPCLLGRSRGGLWVSSWAADHPERFAGIAGIYPVYDLRSYPGLAKAAPAYGLTEAELSQRLNEFNPISRAGVLAKAKLPVYIIHGDEDVVVPLEANSAALAAAYRAAGNEAYITVNVIKGQGHNFWEGFFRCQELVDFVIKVSKP